MENRYMITMDIKKGTILNSRLKQGDTDSSVLEVNLIDNGVFVDITGQAIEFNFLRPDGIITTQDFTNGVSILDSINGKFQCILKNSTLSVAGNARCDIIFAKDGKELGTKTFNFTIDDRINSGLLSITSINAKIVEWQTEFTEIKEAYENATHENSLLEIVAARGGEVSLPVKINKIDSSLSEKANKTDVANIAIGTPLFASDTTTMIDTTRVYVNTTDGLLYTYNNSSLTFESTGVIYQSTGIADKSVTKHNVDFINNSDNLIDYKNVYVGYTTSGVDGSLILDTGFVTSDYIKVNKNNNYTVVNVSKITRYDIDKKLINASDIVDSPLTFNSYLGEYIRVSMPISTYLTSTIVKGSVNLSTPVFYSKLSPTIEIDGESITPNTIDSDKISFINKSTNLFSTRSAIDGFTIDNDTGNLTVNASYSAGDFIKVEKQTRYIVNNVHKILRYDKNKNVVSNAYPTGATMTFNTYESSLIRIVCLITNKSTAQLNKGDTLLPYEEFYETLTKVGVPYDNLKNINIKTEDIANKSITPEKTDFIVLSTNLYSENTNVKGLGISSTDGSIVYNYNWQTNQELIPVVSGMQYTLSGISKFARYDKNKVYISSGDIADVDVPNKTITIPLGVCYIRVAQYSAFWSTPMQINEGSTLLEYEKYYKVLKGIETSKPKNYYFSPAELQGSYVSDVTTLIDLNTLSSIYAIYDDLVLNYPTYITKENLGNDASGIYPIYKYTFKPVELTTAHIGKSLPKIILTAGVHAEERAPINALAYMMKAICTEWKTNSLIEYLRFNVEFIVIPVLNPWGFATGTTRHNYNRVDINRNYSEGWVAGTIGDATYGGESPFSEPESQYVKSILDNNKDTTILYSDLHAAGSGAVYSELMYHVITTGNYYNQTLEISAKYNIEKMTREYIKNYNLPENEGIFGWIDRSLIGGIAPLYALSIGIPSTSSECFYRLPNEVSNYSSNSIKACSEWLINWVLTVIKQTKNNYTI